MNFFEKIKRLFSLDKSLNELQEKISIEEHSRQQQITDTEKKLQILNEKILELNNEVEHTVSHRDEALEETKKEQQKIIDDFYEQTSVASIKYREATENLSDIESKLSDTSKKFDAASIKLRTAKLMYKKISNFLDKCSEAYIYDIQLSEKDVNSINELAPTVELPLHSYDVKELKSLSRQNNKILDETLSRYEKRYTTKSNKAIYQLMVIALRAELQNILMKLKFTTLDDCKKSLKQIIAKYLSIAADGNRSIAPTLNAFILEIETLFERCIDIEYEYYVKKEKERAEQQALRDQMKQEAAERKELERQKQQVEKEEQKYQNRINDIKEQLLSCLDNNKIDELNKRIAELQSQLDNVEQQKEEIATLQNGKAGYVYVISNLGSFGDNTFKIGMTRRLEPMDRIKELSSASVPFAFDVHSFIFSDNAVDLESTLHNRLSDKRTNKVNLRKEFFHISIDELEELVQSIDSTAEFNRTMIASEYRQSISIV